MASFLTKIAHNPRVSLGPRDTKLLQEVISSERRAVDTTQRLSAEREKSSEALRQWGLAEGPDLGDVLSKVATLYDWLAKAEVQYCEHNSSSRLKFKDIRTKEENLAALRRTRDSLAGKIEAQERKVSKMKEENKDLPNARQRLRDMQQEMIGLENSVLTEETRLGDFKRSATREALSLKLGALLELAEKTVIVAELGKLMVDMLPTESTQPGEQRAYYDSYGRTDELLSEAQRCLQDVVFNPAPISEPFAQRGTFDGDQQHHDGGAYEQNGAHHPTNQFSDHPIADQHAQLTGGSEHAREGQYAQYPDASYVSSSQQQQQQQQQTPYSYTTPAAYPAATSQTYASPQSTHNDDSYTKGLSGSAMLPEQPPPHSGPQLQPLPDFRPLSVLTPPAEQPDPRSRELSLGSALQTSADSGATPGVDGYASRTAAGGTATGLAPPVGEAGWNADRSSLAYMGEAPRTSADGGSGGWHEEVEAAREAREAFENEARDREEQAAQQQQQRQEWSYNTQEFDAPPAHGEEHAGAGEEVLQRDMAQPYSAGLSAPSSGNHLSTLSPIVEVPTPAMTHTGDEPPSPVQPEAPALQQQVYEYQPLREAQRAPSPPPSAAIEYNRPPSAADKRIEYGEERSPPPSATFPGSQYPSFAAGPSPAPASPATAAPPMSPISPSAVPPSSFAPSAFEPRPLTPSSQRRPIQIRPAAPEAALGSKYGDVYVPGSGAGGGTYSPSAAASPRAGPGEGAQPSGYFGASSSSLAGGVSSEGKRTVTAGAFRRVGGPAGGAGRFAPSGYNTAEHPPLERSGPSESERIAQAYRSSGIPLSPDPAIREQQEQELAMAGEGELPAVEAPRFDTQPLRVDKSRNSQAAGGPGVARSGTLPSHISTAHSAAPSYASHDPYQQPPHGSPAGLPYDAPMSPTSQEGFGERKYVTRLD
ncbi:hypothetical protein JCM10213_001636 [Rhodosporidiobolus nylandii]